MKTFIKRWLLLIFLPCCYGFGLVTIQGGGVTANPFDTWGRSCKLTIQNSEVPGNLAYFPVLLTLDTLPSEMFDADGSYPALNGGGDIRFSSDADGLSRLACEVVTFTIDNDPANGAAEIYVKVPYISSSTNTDIYVWYNKTGESQPSESESYGKHDVWDNDFNLVQHMSQDPSGSSPQMIDSTDNSNDGDSEGTMTSGDLVVGKIGNGIDFDGTDDNINLGDSSSLTFGDGTDDSSFTISAFLKPASIPEWGGVVCKSDGSYNTGEYQIVLHDDPSGSIAVRTVDESTNAILTKTTSSGHVSAGNWLHITTTYDGSGTNGFLIYADGSSVAFGDTSSGSYTAMENTTKEATIGSRDSERFFPGVIDEVRVSGVARSADWIEAEYNNQDSPSTFIIEGTPN